MTQIPNLRQLRAFEAVAHLGSVGQASAHVHVTQPAVTQALMKLEAHYGVTLFHRRPTGSFPTEAGEILLRRVERFFAMLEEAVRHLGTGQLEPRGTVVNLLTNTHIRSLIAIARPETLAASASEMTVSTTTLLRSARTLERALGQRLLQPSVSGFMMTDGGAEFVRRLRLAVRELDYAVEEIAARAGQAEAKLAIGVLPMSGSFAIAAAVNALVTRHPGCQIKIVEGTYMRLLSCLRAGEIDMTIGAIRRPDWASDVVELPLYKDGFCVVVRHGHPLARLERVGRKELSAYEWVMPPPAAPRRAAIDALFAGWPTPITAPVETSSILVIRALIVGSDRISVLTRHELEFDERARLFAVLPVSLGAPTAKGITLRADWLPTTLHGEFIELLRAHTTSAEGEATRLPPPSQRLRAAQEAL